MTDVAELSLGQHAFIPGILLRPGRIEDAEICGYICYETFRTIAEAHRFPPDFPSPDVARGLMASLLSRDDVYSVVAERDGIACGYASVIGFFGHAVGRNNDALKALIGAADNFAGPGLLVPTRDHELMQWCLEHGLRIVQPMTLMSIGLYNQPAGSFLPSVLY